MELVFIYSAEFGRGPAGEGTNLDRRLVLYTRDARRIKSRIEFIYIYIYTVFVDFSKVLSNNSINNDRSFTCLLKTQWNKKISTPWDELKIAKR